MRYAAEWADTLEHSWRSLRSLPGKEWSGNEWVSLRSLHTDWLQMSSSWESSWGWVRQQGGCSSLAGRSRGEVSQKKTLYCESVTTLCNSPGIFSMSLPVCFFRFLFLVLFFFVKFLFWFEICFWFVLCSWFVRYFVIRHFCTSWLWDYLSFNEWSLPFVFFNPACLPCVFAFGKNLLLGH